MNADQKERLLKLAETDPVLAHKVADFMNAGNAETNRATAPQAKIESADAEASESKNLKWYDALLAKAILDNSVSSLGTVVLNNNTANSEDSSSKKLTVTKEQLMWAKIGISGAILGVLTFLLSFLYIWFFEDFPNFPVTAVVCAVMGLIVANLSQSIAKIKAGMPTIKTFLSKNFTVQ